jgi:hypothetical protein
MIQMRKDMNREFDWQTRDEVDAADRGVLVLGWFACGYRYTNPTLTISLLVIRQ